MTLRSPVVLLLSALAVAAWLARIDDSVMPELGRYRDDAYYYFCWVRNLLAGEGPSVGAGIATNGIHVAWCVALAPLAMLGGDAGLVVGARWLGLSLLVASSLVVAWSLRREGLATGLCAIGALAVLADPKLVDEAQNGQETALACLAVALLIAARRAPVAAFASVSVFAVAARSDLFLLVLALAAVRDEGLPRRALVPGLALACYAAWNLAIAGHPLQDSAAPMAWLAHENLAPTDTAGFARALWWWGRPVLLGAPFATMGAAGMAAAVALALPLSGWQRAAPIALVAILAFAGMDDLLVPALAAALIATGPSPAIDRDVRRTAVAVIAGALALVALHWLVRWYPRDYYVVPFGVAGAWAIARYVAVARIEGRWLAVLTLVLVDVTRLTAPPVDRAWQEPMVLAGRFVDRFVAADQPLGVFNAGIVSWYREGPVVNLDGVVARPAFEALRDHRLGAFLEARGVEWLCDNPVQFTSADGVLHACGEFFGRGFDPERELVEVARFVGTGADAGRPGTGSFRLMHRGAIERSDARMLTDLGPRPGGGRFLGWRGAEGDVLSVDEEGQSTVLARGVPRVVLVLSAPPPRSGYALVRSSASPEPLLRYSR